MNIQLSHFLGAVVAAEYEKLENDLIMNVHRIVESKSNDSTSDSEASQTKLEIRSGIDPTQGSITDVKRKRPKYSDDEQKRVIQIYDSFSCKLTAMKAINEIRGYENIYKRKIERWKRSSKSMGRPVSREFENEVIQEYRHAFSNLSGQMMSQYVTNSSLKKCALIVFDREYWDDKTKTFVKKWHLDKLTCNLCFTSKWISGVLKRSTKSIITGGSICHTNRSDGSISCMSSYNNCPCASARRMELLRCNSCCSTSSVVRNAMNTAATRG